MIDVFSVRHADQRSITSADQVELEAIRHGSAVADEGIVDEALSGEIEDLEVASANTESWQRYDIRLEDEVGAIRQELIRRKDILQNNYPFKINAGQLIYNPSNTGMYEYCLSIATINKPITKAPYNKLPRSFERIVSVILQKHMGSEWESMHTGWPRNRGQPTRLDRMLQKVSTISCDGREWVWCPEAGFPHEYYRGGDAGLDFVVWRPAPDNRIGQVFVVGQCACGNDWGNKFDDLKIERLQSWMRPFTHVPIIRCFTTPFLLSNGNFLVAHKTAGWVLDRLRLTAMAEDLANDPMVKTQIPILQQMFALATAA